MGPCVSRFPWGSRGPSAGAAGPPRATPLLEPTANRKDEPSVRHLQRGSRSAAALAATSPAAREAALAAYDRDITGGRPQGASIGRTWGALHAIWFRGTVPVFPLTPDSIRAVGVLLKTGGYRSAASYVCQAKDMHLQLGFPWGEHLSRAQRHLVRSCTRGQGPPGQAAELDVRAVLSLEVPFTCPVPGAPLGLKHAFVVGIMYCLREVELAHIRVKDVTVSHTPLSVRLLLPASKTDQEGHGVIRTWHCVCEAGGGAHPCPPHAVLLQLASQRQVLGEVWLARAESRLFPDAAGSVVTKAHLVDALVWLGKLRPGVVVAHTGRSLISGHSLRVTGARWLARVGLPLVTIQLIARWESDVVRRYVKEAPLERLPSEYAQAAGRWGLTELLQKTELELTQMRDQLGCLRDDVWSELLSLRKETVRLGAAAAEDRPDDPVPQVILTETALARRREGQPGFVLDIPPRGVSHDIACSSAPHVRLLITCDTGAALGTVPVSHANNLCGLLAGSNTAWETVCGWRYGMSAFMATERLPAGARPCVACSRRVTFPSEDRVSQVGNGSYA